MCKNHHRNNPQKLLEGHSIFSAIVANDAPNRTLCQADNPHQFQQAVAAFREAPKGVLHPISVTQDENGTLFFITKWVNGISLVTMLRQRGSFTLKEVLRILRDLAPAFDYAVEHRAACSPVAKERIQLAFPEDVSIGAQFDELLRVLQERSQEQYQTYGTSLWLFTNSSAARQAP